MSDDISDKLSSLILTKSKDSILTEINERINKEVCYETIAKLNDENLRSEYLNKTSVKNSISELETILNEFVSEDIRTKIIDKYLHKLIPPGTKSSVRGNKFNRIVKDYINNLKLDPDKYEVCFESNCEKYTTDEIPDWYILEKETNRVMIGMNQMDLWNGGHQLNRGYKYIKLNETKNITICVVCSYIQFKSSQNKAFKLFEIGYKNNTLCYLNNLSNIISQYFNI